METITILVFFAWVISTLVGGFWITKKSNEFPEYIKIGDSVEVSYGWRAGEIGTVVKKEFNTSSWTYHVKFKDDECRYQFKQLIKL